MSPTDSLSVVLIEKSVEVCYIGLLAYIAHLIFSFLRHRLDVLGKDAVLFYRRAHWSETETTETDKMGDQ